MRMKETVSQEDSDEQSDVDAKRERGEKQIMAEKWTKEMKASVPSLTHQSTPPLESFSK